MRVLAVLVLAACAAAPYPAARRAGTPDDPYRWLEALAAPETRAWVAAERALTAKQLGTSHAKLAEELAALEPGRAIVPKRRGDHWFYARSDAQHAQPLLYIADTLGGPARVVLDPAQLSPDGSLGYTGASISPRGTYVAYGLSHGGSDWVEWRVREVATGRDLPDRLEWTKYYMPAWSADERALYYSRFPQPAAGSELGAQDRDCAVHRHDLGATGGDPIVYARPDQPTYQFMPRVTEDGRWLVVTAGDGQVGDRDLEELYAIELGSGTVVPIATGFDASYAFVTNDGARFLVHTGDAVIAIEHGTRTTVIPPGTAPLREVLRSGDRLVAHTFVGATSRLTSYALDGSGATELPLPGLGTADILPMPRTEPAIYFLYTDFATPTALYRWAPGAAPAVVFAGHALDDVVTEQIFARSADGTRVPMFVAHRRGIALDGSHPTLLTGYGASADAESPYYDTEWAWWLAHGGVLALAVIRGGPELGADWQHAAEKTHRQRAYDDFLACADALVTGGYTTPARLAIEGGSNGGLLVAVALEQRPAAFGAVVVRVGVLDMLRFHLAGEGAGWTGVYGSPDVPAERAALRAYSPVHNARPARYPPTLIITGENETRVVPWHSYKLAAALQHAQRGPAPILLDIEAQAGHFGATTRSARLEDLAAQLAFVWRYVSAATTSAAARRP
ncbi:MAG TPA: prolyl oligopeptidase family serine peptidase [Kofleriaceae bacterium]|jgi:prolyl oligopeptidase